MLSSGPLAVTVFSIVKLNMNRSVCRLPSSRVRLTLAKEGANRLSEEEMTYDQLVTGLMIQKYVAVERSGTAGSNVE